MSVENGTKSPKPAHKKVRERVISIHEWTGMPDHNQCVHYSIGRNC